MLRDYQDTIISALRDAVRAGKRRALVVAPTGSGKTHIIAHLARAYARAGRKVALVAHRREILAQTVAAVGVVEGVAAMTINHAHRHAATADVLMLDEAHLAAARMWSDLIERNQAAQIFGFTATPYRLDGIGLGTVFDALVVGPQVSNLIERGCLVPARTFAPQLPDLSSVPTVAGDWSTGALSDAMRTPALVGGIVEHYQRLAAGRQALVFATSIAHSKDIVEAFTAASVPCAHVDGGMPGSARDAAFSGARDGSIRVLSSCNLLSEGIDLPAVSCVILARPTQSETLYRQQIGRGSRPAPGKQDFIVLDHAGNATRHGLFADVKKHTLEGAKRSARSRRDPSSAVRQCLQCYGVYESKEGACPYCGACPPVKLRRTRMVAGELVELTERGMLPPEKYRETMRRIWAGPVDEQRRALDDFARSMGYHRGWVVAQLTLKYARGKKSWGKARHHATHKR